MPRKRSDVTFRNQPSPLMAGLGRTSADLREAVARYHRTNSDLPVATARAMGIAAMRPYFPLSVVTQTYGKLPKYLKDPAWFWWNAIQLAGLSPFWLGFKERATHETLKSAGAWLLRRAGAPAFRRLLQRSGYKDPRQSHRKKTSKRHGKIAWVWTAGGRWHRSWGGFTTILAERRHVVGREYYRPWQRKLGPQGVRVLEKELMGLINPDAMFPNEARWRAVDYLRWRIPELLHRKARASLATVAWVMQGAIPTKGGCLYIEHGHVYARYGRKRWSSYVESWED